MRHRIGVLLGAGAAVLVCSLGAWSQNAVVEPGEGKEVSGVQEKETILREKCRLYGEKRDEILRNLEDAVKNHRADERYMSPLHVAIRATRTWRVTEAERTLLSLLDYELDDGSIPIGMEVAGHSFFPAAESLMEMRVDTTKVNDWIINAADTRSIRLLAWLLARRTGSTIEAQKILDGSVGPNVRLAVELLGKAEHSEALLPTLRSRPGEVKWVAMDAQRRELMKGLGTLGSLYREQAAQVAGDLREATKGFRGDRRYMSPLHMAIVCVGEWRVFEADADLLSLADYELDAASIPAGRPATGYDVFPAAQALIKLRVDARKVLDGIAGARNESRRRVLTWVLIQRAGSVGTKRLLEAGKTPSLLKALKHVELYEQEEAKAKEHGQPQ